jgi:glyoxylase-like metal-dependent hydrolase (beta-lactamase superfamily II)
VKLPAEIQVFERGWLSSNNILFHDAGGAVLVDSGYLTHAPLTLELVRHALKGRPLARLINTHCHSDHIGGNAALARAYGCRISIPSGEASAIADWSDTALMLSQTGQSAERFVFDDTYAPGDVLNLAGLDWTAIAAPGHDMDALMLYSAETRVLISGDALWENGFGVIFPALCGDAEGFVATRATLESIARLDIKTVIPGHGAPFEQVGKSLERAWQRLAAFERDPAKHARHALKVMLSFSLMSMGRLREADLPAFIDRVPVYTSVNQRFLHLDKPALCEFLVSELARAGALVRREGWLAAA